MSYASEKRWENLWYFRTDLMKLYRKVPTNPAKVKAVQDRKVRELMKIAYGIPFYRERFEATGTTPEDYTCAEDLYKFPVLTKEELRDWSNLELDEYPEKYKDWHISPTSGSTGVPLRTPFSPKENAWNKANFMRSIMLAGFKPGIHKCLHRPNSLHTATGGKKSWTQQLIDTRWKDMSDAIKTVPGAQPHSIAGDQRPINPTICTSIRTSWCECVCMPSATGCTSTSPSGILPSARCWIPAAKRC